MPDASCLVCPHLASQHVMAESARQWKGDYCTICGKFCKEPR